MQLCTKPCLFICLFVYYSVHFTVTLFCLLQVIETDLTSKTPEFQRYMKTGTHSDLSDSMCLLSPSKTVKFYDENTLERKLRKSEIKQCMVLDTIVSGSEGEDSEDDEKGIVCGCGCGCERG